MNANILEFEDFSNESIMPRPDGRKVPAPHFPLTPEEKVVIDDFKAEVERALVQEIVRPNFGANKYSSRPKTLKELIEDLQSVITDFAPKAKSR
jgi:hypothetical protein